MMDMSWTTVVEQAKTWWNEYKDAGQLGAAILGLVTALITLMTACLQRATAGSGPAHQGPPGLRVA